MKAVSRLFLLLPSKSTLHIYYPELLLWGLYYACTAISLIFFLLYSSLVPFIKNSISSLIFSYIDISVWSVQKIWKKIRGCCLHFQFCRSGDEVSIFGISAVVGFQHGQHYLVSPGKWLVPCSAPCITQHVPMYSVVAQWMGNRKSQGGW